jgi:hypothetical protein
MEDKFSIGTEMPGTGRNGGKSGTSEFAPVEGGASTGTTSAVPEGTEQKPRPDARRGEVPTKSATGEWVPVKGDA